MRREYYGRSVEINKSRRGKGFYLWSTVNLIDMVIHIGLLANSKQHADDARCH